VVNGKAEHTLVQDYISRASSLPAETDRMEAEIAALQTEHESTTSELQLPLADTVSLLSAREAELARLEREMAEAETALPRKQRQLEALNKEISPMEMDKEGLEKFASEAVRMRESARAQGKADRENMGRWYWLPFVCERGIYIDGAVGINLSTRAWNRSWPRGNAIQSSWCFSSNRFNWARLGKRAILGQN
jgi:DNA repair exonuclease SbcCD ATPase subunit